MRELRPLSSDDSDALGRLVFEAVCGGASGQGGTCLVFCKTKVCHVVAFAKFVRHFLVRSMKFVMIAMPSGRLVFEAVFGGASGQGGTCLVFCTTKVCHVVAFAKFVRHFLVRSMKFVTIAMPLGRLVFEAVFCGASGQGGTCLVFCKTKVCHVVAVRNS